MKYKLSVFISISILYLNFVQIITPHIAMPRIPHDIIFLTGGWHYNHPVATVQAYDTRADRWIDVPHEDPAGKSSYASLYILYNICTTIFFN